MLNDVNTKEKNWRLKKMKKKTKREQKRKRGKREGKKEERAESKKRVAKNLRSQIIRRCVFQSNENE